MTDEPDLSSPPFTRARPGTVEDVLAAPASPKVGAFFDLDGTLIAGYTAGVFFKHRLRRREVGVGELSRTFGLLLRTQAGHAEFDGDLQRFQEPVILSGEPHLAGRNLL